MRKRGNISSILPPEAQINGYWNSHILLLVHSAAKIPSRDYSQILRPFVFWKKRGAKFAINFQGVFSLQIDCHSTSQLRFLCCSRVRPLFCPSEQHFYSLLLFAKFGE